MYAFLGLGVMAGFVFYVCPIRAKAYLSPMFVNVCFNFTPFLSQVVAYLMQVQVFPGTWTTYGGACFFIGCTLLAMDYDDQRELAKIPLIGKIQPQEQAELTQISEGEGEFTSK